MKTENSIEQSKLPVTRRGRNAVRNSPALKKTYLKLGDLGKPKKRNHPPAHVRHPTAPRLLPAGGMAYLKAMRTYRVTTLLIALNACAGSAPTLYAGPLHPLAGTCDPSTRAQLSFDGQAVLFAPTSGTLILRGQRTGQTLAAAQTLPGADHKPYTLTFRASIDGANVNGVYQTPRCRYAVTLRPISP